MRDPLRHHYDLYVLKKMDSKIVAYSGWQYPYTLTEEQRKVKEARDNARKDDSPEGSNKPLIKEFFTQLINGRKKWIVPGKTFCESLIVFLLRLLFLLPCMLPESTILPRSNLVTLRIPRLC